MKKIIALIILVIMAFSFCACKSNKPINANDETSDTSQSENQITKLDFTAAVPAKTENAVRYTSSSLSMALPPLTNEKEMYDESPIVFRGKVVGTDYLLKGSEVYTKSEVEVLETYKGNLKKGQIIKIRELGGFVPSDVFDNALSIEKFGTPMEATKSKKVIYDIRIEDNKVMENDEDVILFVYPIDYSDFKEFQTNSYQLIRGWQGKLLFNEKLGVYAPYVSEKEANIVEAKCYTLSEFQSFAKQASVKK
ncbi:MAG: hypothetical protein NC110_03955 [Ruminococcus sp.]|nr:hypothetical protein [Ruminococcus sp.]